MVNFISYAALSFIFAALSIFLNIPGDEPDISIRFVEFSEANIFGLYQLFSDVNIAGPLCNSQGNIFLTTSIVECKDISHDFYKIKFSLFLIYFSALIFVLNYSLNFRRFNDVVFKRALLLQFLLPGFPYYLTLLSPESLFNLIALIFTILYYYKIQFLVRLIICPVLFVIDSGNFMVFGIFLFLLYLFNREGINIKLLSMVLLSILLILALFREEILLVMARITGQDYLFAIYNKISSQDETNKYPIVIRYLIFFWSSLDYRPSGVNTFITFLMLFIPWLMSVWRFLKCEQLSHFNFRYFLASIFTPLLTISMLPTYAFGKYYIFLMPFIVTPIFYKFQKKTIILYAVSVTVLHYLLMAYMHV